jgi:hypothetical protein
MDPALGPDGHDQKAEPGQHAEREAAWHATLAPYDEEFGIAANTSALGGGRAPFGHEVADVLDEFRPAVVSFHFDDRTPPGMGKQSAVDRPWLGFEPAGRPAGILPKNSSRDAIGPIARLHRPLARRRGIGSP